MGKKISEILLRGLPKKGIINLCSWGKKIINMKVLDHVCVSHSKANQYVCCQIKVDFFRYKLSEC